MCGIAAVLRRPRLRSVPSAKEEILRLLGLPFSEAASPSSPSSEERFAPADWADFDRSVRVVSKMLSGPAGIFPLVRDSSLRGAVAVWVERVKGCVNRGEELFDALWSIRMDRLREASAVADFLGEDAPDASLDLVANFWSIQVALSAIDRLEVRGRDSAGLAVIVTAEGLGEMLLAATGGAEAEDPLGRSGSRLVHDDAAAFVYKVAAEIGELGDNTRALAEALASDTALRQALKLPGARCDVLAHTRWASVGLITEPNAHPLTSPVGSGSPGVLAAVNGDIDNYLELVEEYDLEYPMAITTDSRVVPGLFQRFRSEGQGLLEAFRSAVGVFEGSHAVAACALDEPGKLLLTRQGSGQALYAGLCKDAYLVVSEPHALVEQTDAYLRIDGSNADGGEILLLDVSALDAASPEPATAKPAEPAVTATADTGEPVTAETATAEPATADIAETAMAGVRKFDYDGAELSAGQPTRTLISSADVHRGDFPHYLLKEINEAPISFAKTIAGRITPPPGHRRAELSEALSFDLSGLNRVICIGQGTAGVAAAAIADILASELSADVGISVSALPSSELSGFKLNDHMSDCLVVAVSQSGTTTDTNRTIDLVKSRGARVLAVVNRRESDLANRADGVLYTSDGRDVEMSVASTKAFYSQVAAGFLLACSLAETLGGAAARSEEASARRSEILSALETLPDAMGEVLRARQRIAECAKRLAPSRRHWAAVGNGPNRLAAEELRIKLSELCYRSVSCDATENKKHIDLSAEPLILVCAAGLHAAGETNAGSGVGSQSVLKDVIKEVDIYRAHRGAPIVLTDHPSFKEVCSDVVLFPAVHPSMAFVLAAMAGHLFSYEAALAIDAGAEPLRRSRAAMLEQLEQTHSGAPPDAAELLKRLAPELRVHSETFERLLRSGEYDGHLPPSLAVRVSSLFKYATGVLPLSCYELEFGRLGAPADVLENLLVAMGEAAEELKRPIDAIRHQAKTVTVGISRSEEALLKAPLLASALETGTTPERLSYECLATLAGLSPAVAEVTGSIRYAISGDRIEVVNRSGAAAAIPSRVDSDHVLRGTKLQVCHERRVMLTKGRRDRRTILLLPEVKGRAPVGLVLLHVELHDRLDAAAAKGVMRAYRDRYNRLRNAVTETEVDFDSQRLAVEPVFDLLAGDLLELADRWRQPPRPPSPDRVG